MDYHSSGQNATLSQPPQNQMSHSLSSPSNMDSPGASASQEHSLAEIKKQPSKMFSVQVHFLDGTIGNVQIQYKALGKLLFEQVCKMLNLLEVDYFGLEYSDDAGVKYWLDYEKPMCRQLGLSMVHPVMYFSIKFYTPDPAQLEEEYTRYLFSLQIKKDLAQGLLQCNENTAALMASYIVQSECGDYNTEDYPDHTYLSSYKFVPNQDADFQRKIMENHKKHVGQTPSEADLNLLETARRCELYGIRMTPAKDNEGVPLNLATAHMGVLVFQNYTKINTFSWAKIRKLSFKRKRFLIKLHPEGYGFYKDSVEFNFESRNECKNFWKKCIENHAFFRCAEVKKVPRQKTRIFSRGSSFRYSGRTQKQIVEFVRENYIKRQPFQRSTSLRVPSSTRSGVGTSISAQPLLPVSGSQSCGSVIISSDNASSNRPSSPSDTPPRPPPHQHANSVSQPVSPTHHRITNGGSSISNERDSSPRAPSNGYAPQSRGGARSDGEDDSLPTVTESPAMLRSNLRNVSSLSGHGVNDMSAGQSETASLSARGGFSSDSEAPPKSPSSPYRSWREGSSTPVSPRSDTENDSRRRKIPSEKAYYVAKELLMTERSYKKDLELLNVWFRDEVSKEENMPTEPLSLLFHLVDPLYEHHCNFLRNLEQRVAAWEGKVNSPTHPAIHGIGDIILDHCGMTKHYDHYIDKLPLVLERLNNAYKYSAHFNQVYRDFEMQKVCYLPLMAFLLRPCHRLQHYCLILERFITYHNSAHPDWNNCKIALLKLQSVTNTLKTSVSSLENYVKLMELQRDLTGLDNLIIPGREFLREGCLQKLSRKGYQQRMFFLFSDVLLYTSRASTPQLQFKVHGQLPLQGVMVEATEPKMGVSYCFTIYGGNRALMVASTSENERIKWLDDLTEAVTIARDPKDERFMYSSLHSCSSSDELADKIESPQSPYKEGLSPSSGLTPSGGGVQEKHLQHRSNTTVHVCWHRNASVGRKDYQMAMLNYLSGYLLRKFKNSSGWQKLWVVFTNFCLFFYKSYQDDFPLASLPLLGYSVSTPQEQDNISKEFVFKLQFKNHVYFFRAESDYTFSRWVEVISSATLHHQ